MNAHFLGELRAHLGAAVRRLTQASPARRVLDLPLRWRVGALVVAGLVAIFVVFGALGLAIARDDEQRILTQRLAMGRLAASSIDAEINQQFQRLTGAARDIAAAGSNAPLQQHILDGYVARSDSFLGGIFLIGRHDQLLLAKLPRTSGFRAFLAAHPRVRSPLTTSTRYVSGVHAMGPLGTATAVLAVPVFDGDGQVVSVLGELLHPGQGSFQSLVAATASLDQTGHAELIDQHDRVVADSDPRRVLGLGEHPDVYVPLLARHQSAVVTTLPVTNGTDGGQRHVMAFVSLRSAPWGLSLGGTQADLLVDATRWQWQLTLFGTATLLIALFLVWVTTRSVSSPVQRLTAASRRIAAGDLSTPVPRQGEGEIRALAEAFDDMRGNLSQALLALAVEKSRYEGIVGSMADAVVTTDLDLRITAFNPAAALLTGWQIEQVLGRPCFDIICPVGITCPLRDGGRLRCPLVPEAWPEGINLGITKETIRTRDGRQVVVASTRSAVRDDAGRLAGVVHVLRDISTEEKASRLKDEFLSTISHELRTPLGCIKGYATTLLLPDGAANAETTQRCLRVIVEASDELEELVGNLLDMSKIGAGVLSVSPRPVRVRTLVEAAAERIQIRLRDHQLRLKVPASLPLVAADVHRVEQVLYNLLDNAVKYSPDGGLITVQAEKGAGEVVLSVWDEGLGIPADELGSLFERFQRGRSARMRQIGGSGLGLAICKGIVQAHGGRVWAESPAPQGGRGSRPMRSSAADIRGTVVRFTLPIARGRARQAKPAPPAVEAAA